MKASYKGTRSNHLRLFVDGREIGIIDADHKRITLFEELGCNKKEDEQLLIMALADYDCDNQCDWMESYDEYKSYSIVYVLDEDEE